MLTFLCHLISYEVGTEDGRFYEGACLFKMTLSIMPVYLTVQISGLLIQYKRILFLRLSILNIVIFMTTFAAVAGLTP